MTTQVVNLLHLRSLASGEIPVNMEFGQFAVNVYNVENPTLPTLRDVSLFIGTGGNERVDEDGTDRSVDVALASGFAGEAIQPNKGWVRYTMRKVRVTGDTMTGNLTMEGDLIMSGTSIRFQPGTGEAQLVLPTEAVSVTGELGAIRWNTTTSILEIHNGTTWINPDTFRDYQSSAVPPALRSDGITAIADGDYYYDTTLGKLFFRIAGAWVNTDTFRDYQAGTAAPGTRSDGVNTLVAGDFWYDTTATTPFFNFWDGTQWIKTSDGGVY